MPAHPFLRNLSTGIYLSHMLFAVLFVYGLDVFALLFSVALTVSAIFLSKKVRLVKTIFGFDARCVRFERNLKCHHPKFHLPMTVA